MARKIPSGDRLSEKDGQMTTEVKCVLILDQEALPEKPSSMF